MPRDLGLRSFVVRQKRRGAHDEAKGRELQRCEAKRQEEGRIEYLVDREVG